jgi:ribose transport system permease protein
MCIVLTHLLLSRTRFGLRTFAIGCNPQAARRAGINLDRHIVWIYTLSGLLAGISGILVMSRFVDASPLAGANDNLNAIACVVIGGASLAGGRGSVPGSVIGMGIIAILETGLILANVPPFWQTVAVGLIIVAAVRINQLRDRYREVE